MASLKKVRIGDADYGNNIVLNLPAVYGLENGVLSVTPAPALTEEDDATVDTTWGSEEADVVNNIRTRLGEVEAALIAAGLVEAPEEEA